MLSDESEREDTRSVDCAGCAVGIDEIRQVMRGQPRGDVVLTEWNWDRGVSVALVMYTSRRDRCLRSCSSCDSGS